MPKYKNTSSENVTIKDKDGNPFILEPGKSKETYYYSDDSRLTKISDDPLWSPMAMEPTDIDLSTIDSESPYYLEGFTGAVIPVPADAYWIDVLKISGVITVRRQTQAGQLVMKDRVDAYPYRIIEAAGTLTQLMVSGSGTFQIQMQRKPLTY